MKTEIAEWNKADFELQLKIKKLITLNVTAEELYQAILETIKTCQKIDFIKEKQQRIEAFNLIKKDIEELNEVINEYISEQENNQLIINKTN
jgi:hypothetical protein